MKLSLLYKRKIASALTILTTIVFFTSLHAVAQSSKKEDWQLRKSENGINIYTRKLPGASIDELKTEYTLHTSLSSIAAVLLDASSYPAWIYACEEGKILTQVTPTDQFQYQKINMPAPFSDRDAVIHFTIWQDSVTGIVHTHSLAAPDYVPQKAGIVRLSTFDATYQLIPLPNGDVQIIYMLRMDPGGYIPDWLVNWTIITGPYESTLKMQKQVAKPAYQNSKLSFIRKP